VEKKSNAGWCKSDGGADEGTACCSRLVREISLSLCLSFIHCPCVFATCLGETQHHRTCDYDVGDNMGWRGMGGRFVFLQGSR
jgi:hypothetical protein